MMRTSTNKRAFWFMQDYKNSSCDSVLQAYKTKPSEAKQAAEKRIQSTMQAVGGRDYRVTGHSGFTFTCGYIIPNKTENGNDILVIYTRDNVYEIECDGDYHYWQGRA